MQTLLISAPTAIGLAVLVAMLILIGLLLRNRQRCPRDHSPLRLVSPDSGHHMVFRCPKCGFRKKTDIPVGRR